MPESEKQSNEHIQILENETEKAKSLKEGNGYSAPIIYKAFAMLQEIADHQGQFGASDLSRELKINKSTAYGIIQAFLDLGVVRQDRDTKKLHLGTTLVQLGNKALATEDLRALARPFLENLGKVTRETIFLGTFDEYGITIIDSVDSPRSLKITAPAGARLPLLAGAAGKVFLAHLDIKTQKRLLTEKTLPKFTAKSITDEQHYLAELQRVSVEGYATDYEEYIKGVNAISVPLMDRNGQMLAGIWIVGFSATFDKDNMAEAAIAARKAVEEITDLLES